MFKKIAEFFTGKKPEVAPVAESAPYKVPEPAATTPIVDTADIAIAQLPDPGAVVVVPEAVVPAAVVEQASAKREPAKRGPAKPKAPTAPKAAAPKALPKPKAPVKPKTKPAA